jgi:hypothetical protein
MEMGLKPCQDQFLHPILVLSCGKIRKIYVAKWGKPTKKTIFKNPNVGTKHAAFARSPRPCG